MRQSPSFLGVCIEKKNYRQHSSTTIYILTGLKLWITCIWAGKPNPKVKTSGGPKMHTPTKMTWCHTTDCTTGSDYRLTWLVLGYAWYDDFMMTHPPPKKGTKEGRGGYCVCLGSIVVQSRVSHRITPSFRSHYADSLAYSGPQKEAPVYSIGLLLIIGWVIMKSSCH